MMMSRYEALAYLGDDEPPYPVAVVPVPPRRVLEVGAGAGSGTMLLAEAFPDAGIVSLETDAAARTALAWRVAQEPGLRERVSILPLGLTDTEFLGTFDLVVVRHGLCRVAPADRSDYLTALSRRAGYDGAVVMDDHIGPPTAEARERELVAQARFGDLTCSRWTSSEQSGHGQVTVVDEFVVTDRRGDVVHEARHESTEWVGDRDLLDALVRSRGMVPSVIAEGWIRLTTP